MGTVLLAILVGLSAEPTRPTVPAASTCDASLWHHVYNPERLKVLKRCITVTGVIVGYRTEPDGDRHVKLRVDPQFRNLLNARNRAVQKGTLVLEPVCYARVSQADAKKACTHFTNTVVVPAIRTRVAVTGSYVLDTEANHGRTEIHPVTSIEVLP